MTHVLKSLVVSTQFDNKCILEKNILEWTQCFSLSISISTTKYSLFFTAGL